ncbi:MAG: tRNA (guanosine(37)-N1)-methyltransferase TrmD [Patescibacteria group bacterium]|nr:tRNA (guanosine(37)-N1)-methyltransferase TrmD [Patescibacteria group bacterium]
MRITILTLFPKYFESPLDASILGKARSKHLVDIDLVNIRDFAQDKHQTTDDRPFGGGPGMVMKVEPIDLALASLNVHKGQANTKIMLLSAKGPVFDQAQAREFSELSHLMLICGHYQDVDQRVVDHLIDGQLSVGQYILTGGEPAGLVVIDAVTRLLPQVLGNQASLDGETYAKPGYVSPPQYTRPAEYKGWQVPEILLSGDDKKIADWKKNQLAPGFPLARE